MVVSLWKRPVASFSVPKEPTELLLLRGKAAGESYDVAVRSIAPANYPSEYVL